MAKKKNIFKRIGSFFKKNWKKLTKALIAVFSLVIGFFIVKKVKDVVYDAIFGKWSGKSSDFKTIPGEEKKILVKKGKEWVNVSLEKLKGNVKAKDVKAVGWGEKNDKPIVEVLHEREDVRNRKRIDDNAHDALFGTDK